MSDLGKIILIGVFVIFLGFLINISINVARIAESLQCIEEAFVDIQFKVWSKE